MLDGGSFLILVLIGLNSLRFIDTMGSGIDMEQVFGKRCSNPITNSRHISFMMGNESAVTASYFRDACRYAIGAVFGSLVSRYVSVSDCTAYSRNLSPVGEFSKIRRTFLYTSATRRSTSKF